MASRKVTLEGKCGRFLAAFRYAAPSATLALPGVRYCPLARSISDFRQTLLFNKRFYLTRAAPERKEKSRLYSAVPARFLAYRPAKLPGLRCSKRILAS